MKTLSNILIFVFSIALFHACNSTQITQTTPETEVNTTECIDSLALQLQHLDSITNCGNLIHMDIYQIGKLSSIEVSVQSVDDGDTSLKYINFRKDCGNDYYYSWEDARLMPAECQYLISAIETIKSNLERTTDHEERYAYITKDDIRVFAHNNSGKNWKISFSIDFRKEKAEIYLSEANLDKLISLIQSSLAKIEELD